MNSLKEAVKTLAEDFVAAAVRRDTLYLKRILADDFVGIGPHGLLLSKMQWLQRFESGGLRYEHYTMEKIDVRLFGDAAGIVTALDTICGRHGTRALNGRFRSSHVWVKQRDRWRLAAHHLTRLSLRRDRASTDVRDDDAAGPSPRRERVETR
jgi:ketosteroid isomerase-like protein